MAGQKRFSWICRMFAGALLGLCLAAMARAGDLYVKPAGADGAPGGRVFHSIQAAIQAAQPGDTIHLDPKGSPYRAMAVFNNKSGLPGKPIVLDGEGSTLLGCDPIDPEQWSDQGNGVWKSTAVAARLRVKPSVLGRFFFVFAGRPQYMGGASKGRRPTLKPPAALQSGEWTYDAGEKAFYIRIPADRTLKEAHVEIPMRSAGVALRGDCSHLVVRNLKAGRVWNDGFNIHGRCSDVSFEHIEAFECGDDGISAHDECSISVDGFVSRGNANGICHVGHSRSRTNHALIVASRAYDLYLLDPSTHELRDVIIQASGPRGVCFTRNTRVSMNHVVIESAQHPVQLDLLQGAAVEADRCIFWNVNLRIDGGRLALNHCAVGGDQSQVNLKKPYQWQGRDNWWNVREFNREDSGGDGRSVLGFAADTGNEKSPTARAFTIKEAVEFTGARIAASTHPAD